MTDAEDRPARPRSAGASLIVTNGLQVGYDGSAILPPIDIDVRPGAFWAIVGPNGGGKSTFVRTLLGLDRPVRGTVSRDAGLRPCYVPQHATLDPIFPVGVLQFVLMGVIERRRLMGLATRADRDAAASALAEVGASDLGDRLLRDLSGGQRQKVLLARALVARANLFVLDEPTAALDVASERDVLELVSALATRRGAAVVMITHLVKEGLSRADHVLLVDRDRGVAISGSPREIVETPELQRLYGPLVARPGEPR